MGGIHADVRDSTFYSAFDVCMLEDKTSYAFQGVLDP